MEKLKHIRLSKQEEAIVNRLAKNYGITFTAAIGIIIREWDRTSEKVTTTGGNGTNHEQD